MSAKNTPVLPVTPRFPTRLGVTVPSVSPAVNKNLRHLIETAPEPIYNVIMKRTSGPINHNVIPGVQDVDGDWIDDGSVDITTPDTHIMIDAAGYIITTKYLATVTPEQRAAEDSDNEKAVDKEEEEIEYLNIPPEFYYNYALN